MYMNYRVVIIIKSQLSRTLLSFVVPLLLGLAPLLVLPVPRPPLVLILVPLASMGLLPNILTWMENLGQFFIMFDKHFSVLYSV